MPYNEHILKDLRQEQFQFNKDKGEYFHYSQHTLNPYLSQDERNRLQLLDEIDPRRSRVANYGLPGNAEGTIYDGAIQKVQTPTGHFLHPAEYVIGIDLAKKRDSWSVI